MPPAIAQPQMHDAMYEWLLTDGNLAAAEQARSMCSDEFLALPDVRARECLAKMMALEKKREAPVDAVAMYEEVIGWLEGADAILGLSDDKSMNFVAHHLELRTQVCVCVCVCVLLLQGSLRSRDAACCHLPLAATSPSPLALPLAVAVAARAVPPPQAGRAGLEGREEGAGEALQGEDVEAGARPL